MMAKDVMTTEVATVRLDAEVPAIARLLLDRRISAVPVVDECDHVVGIVSEGDLIRRPESGTLRHRSWWLAMFDTSEQSAREYVRSHGMRARDVMTPGVITVSENASLAEIATLLESHHIKRVPVIRDGKLIGIVSRANLLFGLAVRHPTEAGASNADDLAIKAAIDEAIREAGVRTMFLNVVVSDGVVHFWGATESEQERAALRVAAENTSGVKRLENHLTLLDGRLRAGAWI